MLRSLLRACMYKEWDEVESFLNTNPASKLDEDGCDDLKLLNYDIYTFRLTGKGVDHINSYGIS